MGTIQNPRQKLQLIHGSLCFQNPPIRSIYQKNPQSVRFLKPIRRSENLFTPLIKCFVIFLDFPLKNHRAKTNKDSVRATTAQLYPGRDIFEFDQGHVTKNQPITVLILLSESLTI